MIVSNLLAKAFNHVVKQPISKFLYGGMMLKATYYGNRPSAIIYKLSRYSSDEENLISRMGVAVGFVVSTESRWRAKSICCLTNTVMGATTNSGSAAS